MPRKRLKKDLELEIVTKDTDIEDITDDIAFKKARQAHHRGSATMAQQSLDVYKWPKLNDAQKLEHSRRDFARIRDDIEELRVEQAEKQSSKKQHTKDLARERQQRRRDRIKAQKAEHAGKLVSEMFGLAFLFSHPFKPVFARQESPEALSDLAAISRPDGVKWKKERNGRHKGTIEDRHSRTNWYHPFLWASINAAAKKAHWSPAGIVKMLNRDQPALFKHLNRGTVHRWLSKSGNGWSDQTLANVANRHALAGSGRVGVLTPYLEIVKEIKTKLTDLRATGVPVNVLVGQSIALAIIQNKKPELLRKFTCSEVRLWIQCP